MKAAIDVNSFIPDTQTISIDGTVAIMDCTFIDGILKQKPDIEPQITLAARPEAPREDTIAAPKPTNITTIQSDFLKFSVPSKPKPHLEVLFGITEICDLIATHLYVYDVLNLRQTSKHIAAALADTGAAYRELWVIGPEGDFLRSYQAFVEARYGGKPMEIIEEPEWHLSGGEKVAQKPTLNNINGGRSKRKPRWKRRYAARNVWNTYISPATLFRKLWHLRHDKKVQLSKARCEYVAANAERLKAESLAIARAAYPTQHHIRNIFCSPIPEFQNIRTLIFDGWDSKRISFTEILHGLLSLRGKSRIHETMTTLSVRYADIQRRSLLSLKLLEKWTLENAQKQGWELVESSDYSNYYWKKTILDKKLTLGDEDLIPEEEFLKMKPFALKNFYYYTPTLMDHCVIRMVLYTPPFPGRLLQRLRIRSDVGYCESWYVERPGLEVRQAVQRPTDEQNQAHLSAEKRKWRCIFGPGGREHGSIPSSSSLVNHNHVNDNATGDSSASDVEGRRSSQAEGLSNKPKCRDDQPAAICRKCARWRVCWKCHRVVCISCMANQPRTSLDNLLTWGWPSSRPPSGQPGKDIIEPWPNDDLQVLYCRGCRLSDPGWIDHSENFSRIRKAGPSYLDDMGMATSNLLGPEPGWIEAVTEGARMAANRAARGFQAVSDIESNI